MILRWLDKTRLPVIFDAITPTALAGKSPDDVKKLVIPVGNQQAELGDLFAIFASSEHMPDHLTIEGDLSSVGGIGRGLSAGTIVVRGQAGNHLGAAMSGGLIEAFGNAHDYAGAEMKGGTLRIHGSAGFALGASYPGSRLGMRGGVILVDGSTGDDAGLRMRRGLIAIGGDAGDWAGRAMIAGSLFVFGDVGRDPGCGMKRGTIALLGPDPPRPGRWFAPTGCFRFPFMSIYLKTLSRLDFAFPFAVPPSQFERYNGDLAENGHGEILIPAANP